MKKEEGGMPHCDNCFIIRASPQGLRRFAPTQIKFH